MSHSSITRDRSTPASSRTIKSTGGDTPNPEVALTTSDGFVVKATHFQPTSESVSGCIGKIIVAGATGVPQGFYKRFAEFAASQGYQVLTLDYRGVGLSKPASLKGFEMEYLDWAKRDLKAAVDYMNQDNLPLFMVGHSFGGHAFGLLDNHGAVLKLCTFATGAGWHGWMPKAEQLKVQMMWNVIGPVLTTWKGYLPWKMLGMGEDLPLGVYKDWRKWCRYPNYFFEDPDMKGIDKPFSTVKASIRAVNSVDDMWAPPQSRDAFMKAYTGAKVELIDLRPADVGMQSIGHMGYFRPQAKPLWEKTLQWFAA